MKRRSDYWRSVWTIIAFLTATSISGLVGYRSGRQQSLEAVAEYVAVKFPDLTEQESQKLMGVLLRAALNSKKEEIK